MSRSWRRRFGELARAPRVEPLRDGVRVVVAGPPNAGKSSLVNALARASGRSSRRSPGTTRDVIEVPLAIGGVPFVLVDTAGLRESDDDGRSRSGSSARGMRLERADMLLWLGEPGDAPDHPRLILVRAKADLDRRSRAPSGLPRFGDDWRGAWPTLLERLIERAARLLLPEGDELALDRRQHDLLAEAHEALDRAASCRIRC